MALKAKPLGGMSREKLEEALREVTKEPMERLNVNVPRSVYKAFKVKAAAGDTSMSEMINRWIADYVGPDIKQ